MLKIGYVRLCDADAAAESAALEAAGCHVVRAEEPAAAGFDDNTFVLDSMSSTSSATATSWSSACAWTSWGRAAAPCCPALERLERRRASLRVCWNPNSAARAPPAWPCKRRAGGRWPPPSLAHGLRLRRPAAAHEIRALQQAGVGPVEIARRLGVSRMTVWRKLKNGVEA